uniref:Reverse transcriptase zinc-binding domain-containing protein n=1 Tax=Nicotiana tabacum TaxID=4097 RepID=A0A1S3ZZZ6_TOBAC|nr:PREDICTED: uncharacterized protein LOC107792321 [Nicotiana tabacum]
MQYPKWAFNLRLVAHGMLLTRDRLSKWGITTNILCPLCDVEYETIAHIFFQCKYSAAIWERLLLWEGIDRKASRWPVEQDWAENHANGKGVEVEERNNRIFQSARRTEDQLVRLIAQEVQGRGNNTVWACEQIFRGFCAVQTFP